MSDSRHEDRIRRTLEAFDTAQARFVARLEGTGAEDAEQSLDGGWTAAQMGWHVAAVNTFLAQVLTGEVAAAVPAPEGFVERSWAAIAASLPARLEAPEAVRPPPGVSRAEALDRLRASGDALRQAVRSLDSSRAATQVVVSLVGVISLYQVGEWATAHVIRHNRQAKRLLEGR